MTFTEALSRGLEVEARYLRHGQEPEPGETVEPLPGHHAAHARLAWRVIEEGDKP